MKLSLAGWMLQDWSIRPRMLATINFSDFRPHHNDGSGLRRTKLFFVRPTKLVFSKVGRSRAGPIVENVVFDRSSETLSCLMTFESGGSIGIFADSEQVLYW